MSETQEAWQSGPVPAGYWNVRKHRLKYLQWLGKQLGFESPEDWYKITQSDFRRYKGIGLLDTQYNSSPIRAIVELHPRRAWYPWLLRKVPNGFWQDRSNRLNFVKWLGNELGYKTLDDWYSVSRDDFIDNGGRGLLSNYYNTSHSTLLRDLFPEYDWLEWRFAKTPPGFWNKRENRLRYLNWFSERVGYSKPDDWYQIDKEALETNYGGGLLQRYYKNSSSLIPPDPYPDISWHEWRFKQVPTGFWNKKSNRIRYLQWLGIKIGFRHELDWYKITQRDFLDNYGHSPLAYEYGGTPSNAVKELFPRIVWYMWLFNSTPKRFWEHKNNRLKYLKWLGNRLGYQRKADWYKLTKSSFVDYHGSGLLDGAYKSQPSAAVVELYPEYDWKPWLFHGVPDGFWDEKENRLAYVRWLGELLGFMKFEDWYRLKQKGFTENKGGGLLYRNFDGNPSNAVKELFPERDVYEWLFTKVTSRFWHDENNRLRYMKWLGERLGIQQIEEWYEVLQRDFSRNRGSGMLQLIYAGSPSAAVISLFPNFPWKIERFTATKKKQRRVFKIAVGLFGRDSVEWDYKHQGMRFRKTDRPMELDVFIPSKKTAIEYQGEQHFIPIEAWGGEKKLGEIQQRDEEKRQACKAAGIRLHEIPYTWDGNVAFVEQLLLN